MMEDSPAPQTSAPDKVLCLAPTETFYYSLSARGVVRLLDSEHNLVDENPLVEILDKQIMDAVHQPYNNSFYIVVENDGLYQYDFATGVLQQLEEGSYMKVFVSLDNADSYAVLDDKSKLEMYYENEFVSFVYIDNDRVQLRHDYLLYFLSNYLHAYNLKKKTERSLLQVSSPAEKFFVCERYLLIVFEGGRCFFRSFDDDESDNVLKPHCGDRVVTLVMHDDNLFLLVGDVIEQWVLPSMKLVTIYPLPKSGLVVSEMHYLPIGEKPSLTLVTNNFFTHNIGVVLHDTDTDSIDSIGLDIGDFDKKIVLEVVKNLAEKEADDGSDDEVVTL